ncbi:alpha/beta hydrolase [Streptomyces sp. NBC_00124]|nr:alpha/beta hydrolase [Streptomyces sp. NBC_00140]MCX5358549.1 alpha/beta hydrolase [Streptomyces sp. NBC_00124]
MEAWDLPGFGAKPPPHFGSTKEEYVDWLIDRLERIGEPVDLVGHDWGGILTARVASTRPDLVRHVDGPMKQSVLRLYRSALTMGAEWEPALANLSAPALVFWGALDPACQIEFGEKLATAVRASRFLRLDCNHWPLLQMPTAVAAALELHWNQPE